MAKLLMITGDRALAEGKQGAFYNTLEEFHKYWDRIDIITPPVKSQKISQIFGNVFIHSSPWPLYCQPFWISKKGRALYNQHKFDLMTVHEYAPFYNGLGARKLWKKTKIPYVLEVMHIPGDPKAAGLKERLYRILTKIFIAWDAKKARAIRVINQKQTPDFLIKAGVLRSKIIYIPAFYIDLDIFRPTEIQKQYDVIFVGRLAENKGIKLLLEASKITKAKTIIVGDGPERTSIEAAIKNNSLKNYIALHGWARDPEEIAALLNKSKILVMPSYNEGGPRVVLEAMACGLPVIVTKVGLMPDIIKDGESGLFVDWNVQNIARKITDLLENGSMRDKFRDAGLELAKQFERREAIKNYADKLKSLI
jgi:glycosyltransferase involved in cell wall biosynthesis